jgi:hypothetical protein
MKVQIKYLPIDKVGWSKGDILIGVSENNKGQCTIPNILN